MRAYTQKFQRPNGLISSVTLTGINDERLAQSLANFRAVKKLPNSDYAACLQDVQLQAVDMHVNGNAKTVKRPPSIGWQAMVRGGLALVKIIKGDIVEQDELERRANVCAACPHIAPMAAKCTPCMMNSLSRLARTLAIKYGRGFTMPTIRPKKSVNTKTGKLSEFSCGVCSCPCLNLCLSKSKIFLEREQKPRPLHCWANPQSPNWQA